jgi:hypothetical protein
MPVEAEVGSVRDAIGGEELQMPALGFAAPFEEPLKPIEGCFLGEFMEKTGPFWIASKSSGVSTAHRAGGSSSATGSWTVMRCWMSIAVNLAVEA